MRDQDNPQSASATVHAAKTFPIDSDFWPGVPEASTRFRRPAFFDAMFTLYLRSTKRRGFSLVELLVVLGMVSLLASLLFPVFLTARGKAREVSCASNLRQIGMAFAMYQQDNDGYFPYAVDPNALFYAKGWAPYYPQFAAEMPRIKLVHEVLDAYVKSAQVFACPSDIGFDVMEVSMTPLDAQPSSYEKFGTSYYYANLLTACHAHESSVVQDSDIVLMYDPVGFWHGTLTPITSRHNVLFADGHVKTLTASPTNRVLWFFADTPDKFDAAATCREIQRRPTPRPNP